MHKHAPLLPPNQIIAQIEAWLNEDCDWIRVLSQQTREHGEVLDLRFLEDSQKLAEEHCKLYRQMILGLLSLHLDITSVYSLYCELEDQLETYRWLVFKLQVNR